MSKREVVKDLEYWARLAGAYKERRRIRRALSPLRAALVSAAITGTGPYGVAQNKAEARKLLDMLDRATKAPKRKATKGTR